VRKTHKTSYLDELPRGTTLYELYVDVVKSQSSFTTHVLGMFSYDDRNSWYQKLGEVAGSKPPQFSD
jgi:hypothetical protein